MGGWAPHQRTTGPGFGLRLGVFAQSLIEKAETNKHRLWDVFTLSL